MQKDEIGTILDTVKEHTSEAGWICSCNRNLAEITFAKDIPHHEDYEFRIAFAEESPEELIDTILEAIDYEMDSLLSLDFIETFPPKQINAESESSSLYPYADFMSIELKALSEKVSSAIDMIDPDRDQVPPNNKIPQTDTRPQKHATSSKAGSLLHESKEL